MLILDWRRWMLAGVCSLVVSSGVAFGQINEDYVAGDPNGWEDLDTWAIGRQIVGTEADDFPHPITGGDGPSVLTYNLRDGGRFDTFQRTQRDFSVTRDQFESHVIWLEYSSFSNVSGSPTELVKLFINFNDSLGTSVQLQNNWNSKNAAGNFGVRANMLKPRRSVLQTDASGDVVINSSTGLPIVNQVLDGNAPGTQLVTRNLIYQDLGGVVLFGDGLEPADDDPDDADGDQPILNTLFEQQVVLRLDDFRNFNSEAEWRAVNPDASGDGNWRSLVSAGLGSGTEFGDLGNNDSLIVTEPIRDITSVSVSASRRDVTGDLGGLLPNVIRANDKIRVNQASSGGIPSDPLANHQVGLGKFIAQVYRIGDLDRNGLVTVSDLTQSPLLQNHGLTTITDESVTIGAPDRDVTWLDGDTINNGVVTVGDAIAGVLASAIGADPQGPELDYNPANGEVTLRTNGAAVSGFALIADDPQAPNGALRFGVFNNPASGNQLSDARNDEVSWVNLDTTGSAAGGNLTGNVNLGAILPTGLTDQEFEDFFAAAVFNVDDALTRAASFFADAVAGDYNGDGVVDAADYTVWRDGGTEDDGPQGYELWVANFGATGPTASLGVPEPTTGLLALAAAMLGTGAAGRRQSR